MNIQHRPLFDTDKVCKHYSEKDGVPIKYVCTSALGHEAQAMDIFYRETPHPEFGNRYFGMYFVSTGPKEEQRQVWITNADKIEDAEFGMVEVAGGLHYSQHRHDFYSVGDVAVDGGRSYFKRVGDLSVPTKWLKVKNGKFVEEKDEKSSG
jgi:hypothetical protein